MASSDLDVVTGAFGYIGRSIADLLLERGRRVRTLTGHPDRPDPFGGRIEIARYAFGDPDELARSLAGSETLYNTYWIRFPHGDRTFEEAVENSRTLIDGAKRAGLRRIVHISITNPSPNSPFPYFRGKAEVESAVERSGLSYAIVRPTVLFGGDDILVNNVAWLLRRFPVFAIPGDGRYRVRPVHVEDVARLCVAMGEREDDVVIDAVGPEWFTFEDMVHHIAAVVRSRARMVHLPAGLAIALATAIGPLVRDHVLTRDELGGLMAELVYVDGPATGDTRFTAWIRDNAGSLGLRYASELARHYR